MRSIAAEMGQRGFDAELLQCSSDNGSLDGVVFPQIQVAMIDGTAPQRVVTDVETQYDSGGFAA